MQPPRRFPDGVETRAAVEFRATGRTLEGHAAVFGSPAKIGSFIETITPGAFRKSLLRPGCDVVALIDHDPGRLLARQRSGTLRLSEDGRGLAFSIDLARTTLADDVLTMAQRGDLGGMSFGFRVNEEAWPAADRRELRAVDLLEISVVSCWPAYEGTTVSARSQGRMIATPAMRARALAMM